MDLELVRKADPEVAEAMIGELNRQKTNIELIASENLVSEAVLNAMGSHLTNKYAEGYPGNRYYGGCAYVDVVENLAIERAKKLFNCAYANVQPHSGANANHAAFFALLETGDTFMGLDLSCGGHLTHGSRVNYSGKQYNIIPYGLNAKTEEIDYDEVERLALIHRPKLILTGASAYSRIIDFKRFRDICDKVGAYFMVDIAHIAGLVVSGDHPSPFPYADIVTTTTHKTLRGPRGGLILTNDEAIAKKVNKAVFPGTQGGPLMHVIAGKAVAFKEALSEEFRNYQHQVVKNAAAMAKRFTENGVKLMSGGTDNHLMLVNLVGTDITGKELEALLDECHITLNKNAVLNDPQKPTVTSGVRIGTPTVTTRGFKEDDCVKVADLITKVIREKEAAVPYVTKEVEKLIEKYPIYPNF